MKITKQQVKDCYDNKELLKEYFPDVFKPILEEGKWYKGNHGSFNFLKNNTTINGFLTSNTGYGIDYKGDWCDVFDSSGTKPENLKLATKEEVEKALISEAKKRGFKEGVKYIPISQIGDLNDKFYVAEHDVEMYEGNLQLYCGMQWVFADGKWAEIIQETEIELTLDQIA